MGKTPVDDFGLEVLRKAAQDSSDNTKYDLRTVIADYEKNLSINVEQLGKIIDINEKIFIQLKIMNLYLSSISDKEFSKRDLGL